MKINQTAASRKSMGLITLAVPLCSVVHVCLFFLQFPLLLDTLSTTGPDDVLISVATTSPQLTTTLS